MIRVWLTRLFSVAACAFALIPACPFHVLAQQVNATGVVSGQVSATTGELVPGVKVVVTNRMTGQSLTTTTDGNGAYRIANVPAGAATVSFTLPGFAVQTRNDVTVNAGSTASANAVLNLGPPTMATAVAPPVRHSVEAVAPQPLTPEVTASSLNNVIVATNAVAGPMGYAATPSMSAATQSLPARQAAIVASQPYNFPSIIFYISAAPLVNLPSSTGDLTKLQVAQETDQNPQWLDASFTLSFADANGAPLANACSDGSVQVLGLLPQQTVAALKNQTAADVASGVSDVAGALASFYPGTAGQVSAATKAMNVVFQDIFPPQPVAYEYSNMTDNCNFGWYFRPNKSSSAGASGPASILGIQTGIVLLKTKKNIASITVNGRTISAWDKPPVSSSKSRLFPVGDKTIATIALPNVKDIDFDGLTNLDMFPALISKADAMSILHIAQAADFLTFAKANNLVGTNAAYDYVTNVSLAAFFTSAGSKSPAPGGSGAPPAPAAKTPAVKTKTGTAAKGTPAPAKPNR